MANNFQVTDSHFDETLHTQGGHQHLMQHLWDAFLATLKEKIEARKAAGKESVTVAEAAKRTPATAFVQFAAEYLATNRVHETFYIDENMGLRLTNLKSVAVSPGSSVRGTMQDANEVNVTHGRSQADNEGVINISGSTHGV